ncbi:MAG: hypothetical protein L0387_17120 [Acidobacteria bacterium]|nr:hypothetical protein [Acidobacteriota bacterium]MCI0724088.1 hypothetical protein [Acidobacteriota bacterium]
MNPKEDDALDEGYELIDEDHGPLDDFDEERFEAWLRVGLEGYLLEDKGAWAFPGAEGAIVRQDYLALGLRDTYRRLRAEAQSHFRRSVAKVLASLEAEERNAPIFEHLLSLAAELPAPEVLRVLPGRIGNGFLGITANREGDSLFALTLLTVAELAAPRREAVDCLHALVGSVHFDHAYAGIALIALSRADDRGLVNHMVRLREPLGAMFREFNAPQTAKQDLARSVIEAVGIHRLVEALPRLKYFEPRDKHAALDTWLIEALLKGKNAPLVCHESEKGQFYFCLSGRDDVKEFLPEEGESLPDLIELLRRPKCLHRAPYDKKVIRRFVPKAAQTVLYAF